MRLIDADELYIRIKAECNPYGKPSIEYESGLKVLDIIRHQSKPLLPTKWIPCSERLPDIAADVLVSLRSLDVYIGYRASTEGWFYVESEGYVWNENVLAWMPLPEPYKKGESNEIN